MQEKNKDYLENNYMKRINAVICFIIRFLGIIFIGYLFLQGLFTICLIQRVEEKTYYMENNALLQLCAIALIVAAVYFLNCRIKLAKNIIGRHGSKILLLVFAAVMAFFAVWICITRYWYFGDMEKVYQYAQMINSGDYSGWLPGGYPYMWSQQNGLILFVAVLIKFFDIGTANMVFYFINLFFYGVALWAFFSIIKRLSDKHGSSFVSRLMLMLYFPYGFFITMLYGDVIGFSFGMLAAALLFKYFDSRKPAQLAGSCACMIMAVFFKQNELIMFVGLCILLVCDVLFGFACNKNGNKNDNKNDNKDDNKNGDKNDNKNGNKNDNKRNEHTTVHIASSQKTALAGMALYIIIALAGFSIPELIIEKSGNIEIDGGNSKWANIAMGLQECDKAPGWYNCYEENVFEANNYDGEATAAEAKQNIVDRIRYFVENPAYAWKFFNMKLASEWNNPTFESFHIQNWRGTSM